jgi:uncharacterized protein YutE (UPF0331/DUF86 family)
MPDDVLINKAATVERCVARARDVFELLAQGGWIDVELAQALKRMVAFRNIAVHDYQSLLLPILVNVITQHLNEFLDFTQIVLKRMS